VSVTLQSAARWQHVSSTRINTDLLQEIFTPQTTWRQDNKAKDKTLIYSFEMLE
jgi:hypothetical protein